MSVLKTGTIAPISGTIKAAALVLAITALTACATHEVRYVPMQCPDILRPELPVVEEQSLECLADETYFDIQERDQLLRQYADKHEQVCQTFEDLAREAD